MRVDLQEELRVFVPTLDSTPFFLRSAVRTAHTLALHRLKTGYDQQSDALVCQRWTLFLLTSRMLLARALATADEGREELCERVRKFNQGDWLALLEEA